MLLSASGIKKSYFDQINPVSVLCGAGISVEEGDVVGIFGASGSGKSTLLHILGGLDKPDSGTVEFKGEDIFGWNEMRRADFRNRHLGFVFQFYHLLSEFSAVENVMVPALISGSTRDEAFASAERVLGEVGLANRLNHKPFSLSGGEQQRVAIARAIVMKPSLLLADEPTGNLDRRSGEEVWNYLTGLREQHNLSMVVVSHNGQLIESLPKVFELKDGVLK